MADDVTIRTLNAGDLDEVARVCFPENDPDDIRDRLRDELVMLAEGRGWTLVAECGGAVCGTVHVELSHGRGWVHNVAVCEGRRGQGIAGRLLADPGLGVDFARNARRYAETNFDISRIADRFERIGRIDAAQTAK